MKNSGTAENFQTIGKFKILLVYLHVQLIICGHIFLFCAKSQT